MDKNYFEECMRLCILELEHKRSEIMSELGVLNPDALTELSAILLSFSEIEKHIDSKLALMEERLSTIEKLVAKEIK